MSSEIILEEPLMDQIISLTLDLLRTNKLFTKELIMMIKELADQDKLSHHEDVLLTLKADLGGEHENS